MANFPRVKPAGWAANEIYTATQANTLDIDHTKAPNFDDGSAHAPAADIEITGPNGLELQGNLRLKYASRSITRAQPLMAQDLGPGPDYAWTFGDRAILNQTAAGDGDDITITLDNLPDGQVLTAVEIIIKPFAGHSITPVDNPGGVVPPLLYVYRQPIATEPAVSLGGPVTTTELASPAVYEALHGFSVTGIAHTIDTENNTYYAVFVGEGGTDFIPGLRIYGIRTVCTVTDQSEY